MRLTDLLPTLQVHERASERHTDLVNTIDDLGHLVPVLLRGGACIE